MSATDRLDQIEARANAYDELGVPHEGDCCGSLCEECGHCLHSIAICDHDCDGQGHGCSDAIDGDAVVLKRDTVALVNALRAVLDLCGRLGNGYPTRTVQVADIRAVIEAAL